MSRERTWCVTTRHWSAQNKPNGRSSGCHVRRHDQGTAGRMVGGIQVSQCAGSDPVPERDSTYPDASDECHIRVIAVVDSWDEFNQQPASLPTKRRSPPRRVGGFHWGLRVLSYLIVVAFTINGFVQGQWWWGL